MIAHLIQAGAWLIAFAATVMLFRYGYGRYQRLTRVLNILLGLPQENTPPPRWAQRLQQRTKDELADIQKLRDDIDRENAARARKTRQKSKNS